MNNKIIFSEKKEDKENILLKKYPGSFSRMLIFGISGFILALGIFIFISFRITSSLPLVFISLTVSMVLLSMFFGYITRRKEDSLIKKEDYIKKGSKALILIFYFIIVLFVLIFMFLFILFSNPQ